MYRPIMILFLCFFAVGCGRAESCAEISQYTFSAMPDHVEVKDGNTKSIRLVFYPKKGRELKFHLATEDQVYLATFEDETDLSRFQLSDRRSQIEERFVDQSSPIIVNFTVKRKDVDENVTILDFGTLGKIRTPTKNQVRITAYFHPVYNCFGDSRDGFKSEDIRISVVE